MMKLFHVDPSWYEAYWYGKQSTAQRQSWKTVGLAILVVLLAGSCTGARF